VCGECKVLVNRFSSFYKTCNSYCAAVGRDCVAAGRESHGTCEVKHDMTCDQTLDSSDAICQCSPTEAEGSLKSPRIANGEFEVGMDTSTFEYIKTIPSWISSEQLPVIKSGNPSWGGVSSVGGSYFLGLQDRCWISQNVFGHQIGGVYELHFFRAKRSQNTPVLEVWISGSSMGTFAGNANEFESTTIQYTAKSEVIEIKFEQLEGGGTTVFLDQVSIKAPTPRHA